jgi:hypothetical protein
MNDREAMHLSSPLLLPTTGGILLTIIPVLSPMPGMSFDKRDRQTVASTLTLHSVIGKAPFKVPKRYKLSNFSAPKVRQNGTQGGCKKPQATLGYYVVRVRVGALLDYLLPHFSMIPLLVDSHMSSKLAGTSVRII